MLSQIQEDSFVGTWNTWCGEQDQAVHLWMFQGSYPAVTEVVKKLKEKQEFVNFRKARSDLFFTGGIESAAVGDQFWKEWDPIHMNAGPTNSDQEQ